MSGPHYNPFALRVEVPFRSTTMEDAHEHAHLAQHAQNTLPWRAFMALRTVPVLGRVAMLTVEVEASIMATAELKRCGIWKPRDGVEAGFGVLSYVFALFVGSDDI